MVEGRVRAGVALVAVATRPVHDVEGREAEDGRLVALAGQPLLAWYGTMNRLITRGYFESPPDAIQLVVEPIAVVVPVDVAVQVPGTSCC